MSTNHHTALDSTKCYNRASDVESPLRELDAAITQNASYIALNTSAISGKADTSHTHTESDITDFEKPFIAGGTYNGAPTSSMVLLRCPVPIVVTFPASLTESKMVAEIAATAETVFSLKKNGTEFGTATFAASGTSATFAAASEASFAAGDILTIVAPATADATLADLGWAIVGAQ